MKRNAKSGLLALAALTGLSAGGGAQAEFNPFIGEISTFGSNFCPRGWAKAEGQLLPISQNIALFSLIGTFYGGNGVTTFALPDLRGRIIVGVGQGPGLSNYGLGESGGAETVTLGVNEMPLHTHALPRQPVQSALVVHADKGIAQARSTTAGAQQSTQSVGGGQAHENRMPYLAVTTCIAVQGIYPSRP